MNTYFFFSYAVANCDKKFRPNLKIGLSKSRCKIFSLVSPVKKKLELDFPVQFFR